MVYDHYVRQGDPTKAKAAAASIVQYQRKLFQQYTAIAKAAVADGDIDAATKAAIKGSFIFIDEFLPLLNNNAAV